MIDEQRLKEIDEQKNKYPFYKLVDEIIPELLGEVRGLQDQLSNVTEKLRKREDPFNHQLSDYSTAVINAEFAMQKETIKQLQTELAAAKEYVNGYPIPGQFFPEEGQPVMIEIPDGWFSATYNDGKFFDDTGWWIDDVIRWLPLPPRGDVLHSYTALPNDADKLRVALKEIHAGFCSMSMIEVTEIVNKALGIKEEM